MEFLYMKLCDQSCSLNQSTVKDLENMKIILTWTFVTCKLRANACSTDPTRKTLCCLFNYIYENFIPKKVVIFISVKL